MVYLERIYTRTGDEGTTSLGSGKRVRKNNVRIKSYGTVDELNAVVGVVRLYSKNPTFSWLDECLQRIQNELFDLSADLCIPEIPDEPEHTIRILPVLVERLEVEIDQMNKELKPLRTFVLPGGSFINAHLHMARTVSRRAEREMVELTLQDGDTVSPAAMQYINRLSDFFFVASRYSSKLELGSEEENLWTPGRRK